MKKSHERWNEYQAASSEYPEELYKTSERLEKRIKKESRKKKFLFTTIPTAAAAMLFVILVNTSIVFARTVSEIPLLSKISELVMYNESLRSAVENRNIQYVNLKAVNDGIELKLPYVIADSRNLVLFLEMPDLETADDEFYDVSIDHLTDLSNGNYITGGFFSYGGTYTEGQDSLLKLQLEIIESTYPGQKTIEELPKNFELSVSLRKLQSIPGKYGAESHKLLALDSYKFTLNLDDFKAPVIYPLNKEVTIEGQKIVFKEMISYPVRSEIIFEFPEENTHDLELRLSLVEDGIKSSLGSYAYIQKHYDGVRRQTIHITSDYFNPPKTRSISIDRYAIKPKDEDIRFIIDMSKKTMNPKIDGIELTDITRVDGEIIITFEASELYPYPPFSFTLGDEKFIETNNIKTRNGTTHIYSITDENYDTLELIQVAGPEYTLDEPILIPIPVSQ